MEANFNGKRVLALFDVDKTLTPARQSIQQDMVDTYNACIAKGVHMGIVSGSDYKKVAEQVGMDIVNKSVYCFCENGLLALKNGEEFSRQSLKDHLGEENMQRLINFVLRYIADLKIPKKR
jgi:phosphomannomutase